MRLRVLDHGHRGRQRVVLRLMRVVTRTEPDPVAKVSLYRPELFGRAWLRLIESVMRGPSAWTATERELMAAFVSMLNRCPFCVGIHGGIASLHRHEAVPGEDLDLWRDGRFGSRLTAMFEFLEKTTLTPDVISPEDAGRVRAAGLSDDAVADALYVAFIFNTVNRLANAFDFGWETDTDRIRLARSLDRIRYHVPAFALRTPRR